MTPLRFRPLLKRIRWGGTRLGSRLGKPIGDATDVAESWELADHGDDQTIVDGGPYDGWSLARLVRELGDPLFGRHAGLVQFPLLVKFLDASDRLSVQVHPDDALAKQFDPRENGKSEAWVVIDAEPGSRLFAGLRAGVDRVSLERALAEGRLGECLHDFEVRAGDAVFVPAGTVHAIGEGVLLAEVQQSSDLTFRLDDWGRVGTDGRPRQLHVAESLACIDFDRGPVSPIVPRPIPPGEAAFDPGDGERLVACEHFVLDRLHAAGPVTFPQSDRFRILLVLSGGGRLSSRLGEVPMPLGTSVLLPAASPAAVFHATAPTTLLVATLPD